MSPQDELLAPYLEGGDGDYIGEPISQLEHARQAALLAKKAGASDAVVLGAFFHDIGHLCAESHVDRMDGLGVMEHERIGADFLRSRGLSGPPADLVALHVQAKRYLCHTRPVYAAGLSAASSRTLDFQGGPMDAAEARGFERHPLFSEVLRLRAWDEAAKVVDGEGMDIDSLRDMIRRYIEGRA